MSEKFSLQVVIEPEVEPVTVDQVKEYAHIDQNYEDATIAHWIRVARVEAEMYQKRAYIRQTLRISYDSFPKIGNYLKIPRPPLVSLRSVKYYDIDNVEHEISLSQFYVDVNSEPGRLVFNDGYTWPHVTLRKIDALRIEYVAGYDNYYNSGATTEDADADIVPNAVKEAIYLYCTFRNENRCGEGEFPEQFYHLLHPKRSYYA